MRLDVTTVLGVMVGALLITAAIIEGGTSIRLFWNLPGFLIVVGGSCASTAVQFPLRDLVTVPSVLAHAIFEQATDPNNLIATLIRYAEIARRDGILALEAASQEIEDEFLLTGVRLAVDGTDPELIRSMMDTELEYLSERHRKGRRIVEAFMDFCPAWGMVGTIIGMVGMLRHLSDVSMIGPNMATGLLATFYGVFLCYGVFKPLSQKLEMRSSDELLVRQMIIRGVMAIQSGDNPRIVAQKLRIFLPPNQRVKA